ncbi:uncharacterized protein [Aristolochia californica]|uniref:uncharacterized protein n=1 Tax=Aristolochia californica TaxID=171875 RepID=UPI0035DB1699
MASSVAVFDEKLRNLGSESITYKARGRSTAQMRLQRIIQVISSGLKEAPGELRPPVSNREYRNGESGAEGSRAPSRDFLSGFGIDLNLRLGSSGEVLSWEDQVATTVEEAEGVSSVCSGVGGNGPKASGVGLSSSVESGDVSTIEKSPYEECDPKQAVKISENLAAKDDNRAGDENEVEVREVSGITNVEGKARRDGSNKERDRDEEAESSHERDSPTGISHKDEEAVPLEAGELDGKEKRKEEHGGGEGDYLHLLLDAVRHISGDFDDEPPPPLPSPREEEPEKTTTIVTERSEPEGEPEPSRSSRPVRKREWWQDFYGAFEEETAPIVRSKRGRNQILPSRYRDSVLDPWKPLSRQRR